MTRDFARNQIGRFAMLDRFPKTEQSAITDLVDALMIAPATMEAWKEPAALPEGTDCAEYLAKAVVEQFLDGATTDSRCPTASDIKSAIYGRLHEVRPLHNCPDCSGDGFVRVLQNGRIFSGPKCKCWARRPIPDFGAMARAEGMTRGKSLDAGLEAAAKKLRAN